MRYKIGDGIKLFAAAVLRAALEHSTGESA